MFSCSVCHKQFSNRFSLNRHVKTHEGVKFSCGLCPTEFTQKANLANHVQRKHHLTKYGNEYHSAMGFRGNVSNATAILGSSLSKRNATVTTNTTTTNTTTATTINNTANNTVSKRKRTRLALANTTGFVEIGSSLSRAATWYYRKNHGNLFDSKAFLSTIKSELVEKLVERARLAPIKYNLKLESTYRIPNSEQPPENRAFKTSARELFANSDVTGMVEKDFTVLMAEEDAYTGKGSGFTLSRIDGILLGVYEYTPLGASSYIPLPLKIRNKNAVVNPQNIDQCCFKWAILAKYVRDHNNNTRVGENYYREEGRYDFTGVTFPTTVSEINTFERRNPGVSVNVYALKHSEVVYPVRVCDEEKPDHFDLLLITRDDGTHYTYISNFSRLVRKQRTLHEHRSFICKRCFTGFDEWPKKNGLCGRAALEQHKLICNDHKPILPVMPEEGAILKFEAWYKTQRLSFVLYADFEALLLKLMEKLGMSTVAYQLHHPMSYGFLVVPSDDVPSELLEEFDIPRGPIIYRGCEERDQVAKEFVASIVETSDRIRRLLATVNNPIVMGCEERRLHEEKTCCDLCESAFTDTNRKVADHHHLSGKFRQTLCNRCNLQLRTQNFVPCFLHNLSSYDAHFIVTELGYDENTISVIPNSEEKYITFSKYIAGGFSVRFVDTYRFMASSLSNLAKNLVTDDFAKFRETVKVFSRVKLPLVTRKGVYPYEYTDSWSKLEETCLPPKREFYSSLTEEHVSDENYDRAKEVWERFGCRTLGEYSDLYLKVDVLLLADVFENFRDVCMSAYNLDPAWYLTAPGFSFDCMLKYTRVKLQLLDEYEMLLLFERGIRGGLVQASLRYAKANNYKTPEFDADKPESWMVYQDCNNLYGWAMSQYMPCDGFRWGDPDDALSKLDSMRETSDVGRMYEVDISYPSHLHNAHNDLPFLPENRMPPGSQVQKLMATFLRKERHVVHYLNLKQAIDHGLKVEKVHRVLEFRQSPWLAKYISLNTEMRKRAANEFEKDFFKLMNNAVFGKTMENMRKRMEMELVSSPRRLRKLVNRPTFKDCIEYNENLVAVSLYNTTIEFNKPIYVGFTVLEVSKTLMYWYHYDVIRRHYNEDINLMYTDTDSLVYQVMTDDFYKDLVENPDLLDRMDTSNLPRDHPCYVAERKKVPGFFSDECDGRTLYEFVALRAKSYAYHVDHVNREERIKIKAKGIRQHVVRCHMTLEDYKQCLFDNVNDDDDDDPTTSTFNPFRENVSIRSFKHQVKTIRTNKKALSADDDKRVVDDDGVHTLAHGHYRLDSI